MFPNYLQGRTFLKYAEKEEQGQKEKVFILILIIWKIKKILVGSELGILIFEVSNSQEEVRCK